MKIRKVPPGNANWHHGAKFDVAFGDIYTLNAMGDRTKIDVFIRNRTTSHNLRFFLCNSKHRE